MQNSNSASRVLLLGATGNLGLRLIPSLLVHNHTVVAYVRSPSKLHALVPQCPISQLTVVVGDATDPGGIEKAILDNDCDAIVDVAGNQVFPWREYLLPKIAKAVADAAVAVGAARGSPMRAWFIGGMGSMEYPGTGFLVQDYMPKFSTIQHQATLHVLEAIPISALRWSCLCVAMMKPAKPVIEPLTERHTHKLLLKAGAPPGWEDLWMRAIPLVGIYLNLVVVMTRHTTELEDVADFLAEDLEGKSREWVGMKVGIKQREKRTEN